MLDLEEGEGTVIEDENNEETGANLLAEKNELGHIGRRSILSEGVGCGEE